MGVETTRTAPPAAGLARRLAALGYDALLLLALLFVATFVLLPLTGGEAITAARYGAGAWLYRAYLALLSFGYFGWSWTHSGQTLGMKSWQLRLESRDGSMPRWPDALRRFAFGLALALAAGFGLWLAAKPASSARALAGAGLLLPAIGNYAWILFDARGRCLQDLVSRTRIVRA